MLRLLGVLVLAVACGSDGITAVSIRDPKCLYPGDTVAQVKVVEHATGKVISCTWVIQQTVECRATNVNIRPPSTIAACPTSEDA